MDGDGSKLIQRVLLAREYDHEIDSLSLFQGAADDALAMNTSDIAAAGFVSGIITMTDILNVNRFVVPKKDLMEQIAKRLAELRNLYREQGFKIYFLGGETADLPDQIVTATLDVNVHARAMERDLITGNIQPGDHIWGFASDGRAAWENLDNSGIMSNGLTLAATCLLHKDFNRYGLRGKNPFKGTYWLFSKPDELGGMEVIQALTSPTRQWPLLIKMLIDELKARGMFSALHGITINTGGGATKALHLGRGGITYHKCMPTPPGIFRLVQRVSGESWEAMFKDFNCGVAIDVIGTKAMWPVIEEVAKRSRVRMYSLGSCGLNTPSQNRVELETPFGKFSYS